MLTWALMFLGLAGYFTIAGVRKIEGLEEEQLRTGFLYGLTLAVLWTSFGLVGAICLAKFVAGLTGDFHAQELLVRYHDRLHDLGQLPEDRNGEPDGPANGSQPIPPETNRTSSTAASRR